MSSCHAERPIIRAWVAAVAAAATASVVLAPVAWAGDRRPDRHRADTRTCPVSDAVAGADLTGCDFTAADLSGRDLSAAKLTGAILTRADLSGSDLTQAVLKGVDLSTADLRRAQLPDANLSGADVSQQNLSGLDLSGATLVGANLVGTDLSDANLSNADLTRANLRRGRLAGSLQFGTTWWVTTCPDGLVVSRYACGDVERPGAEAGFQDVGSFDYTFTYGSGRQQKTLEYDTTPVRLFYTFQPADTDPAEAPVFVMLNGGPGAGTTANLFANNTAPFTVNKDAVGDAPLGVAANPYSWTAMGNLLYIDPSQTGFSYASAEDMPFRLDSVLRPAVIAELAVMYGRGQDFNAMVDADQVTRALLGFLDDHPDLRDNPVVMVGESYGGTRVSAMLNMLLFSGQYAPGGSSFFHDAGLVKLIQQHFGTEAPPDPDSVARQFGRQVLIQPQLSSFQSSVQDELYWQDSPSIIDDVAAASGHPRGFDRDPGRCWMSVWIIPAFRLGPSDCVTIKYVPSWGRDQYNWSKPNDWTDNQEAFTTKQLTRLSRLNLMLGTNASDIDGIRPGDRDNVFHTVGIPTDGIDSGPSDDPDALVNQWGTLPWPDAYFLSWNKYVFAGHSLQVAADPLRKGLVPLSASQDREYGDMFLRNLPYVRTFLTNAYYDLVIYSPALVEALRLHRGVVSSVRVLAAEVPEAPAMLEVSLAEGETVLITYPDYPESGHAVGASQPDKLFRDVQAWLNPT